MYQCTIFNVAYPLMIPSSQVGDSHLCVTIVYIVSNETDLYSYRSVVLNVTVVLPAKWEDVKVMGEGGD